MSNSSNRGNSSNTATVGPRAPKFVYIVRPSFTTGDCRAYFTKEDAIKDFGRPIEDWVDQGHRMVIDKAPRWEPFDITWELEKVEVRSLVRETIPTVTPAPAAPVAKTEPVKAAATPAPVKPEAAKAASNS